MIEVLVIGLGYVIGSVSLSYFLGRILKKIDIRDHGRKYAGTLNTHKVLGLWPAVITAVFDLSKGLLSMYIASLFGVSPVVVHTVGLAAILGHVFPFYLRFRGGQGVATATGLLLYYLCLFYIKGWLPWESLAVLAICVLSFSYITKTGEFVATVVLPVLGLFVVIFSPSSIYQHFLLSVIVYIVFVDVWNIHHRKMLKADPDKVKKEINWRLYLRPFALLLVFCLLQAEKTQALTLIGSVACFFILLDLIRLFSKGVNVFLFTKVKDLYKDKEYKKFSSITLFLVAVFLIGLLFEKHLASVAITFLIFGDFFSKFYGIYFGRVRLFGKTFEGSLAHFTICLIVGYVFSHFFSIPILVYVTGAFAASFVEVLPLGVNDNFSVGIIGAAVMYVFSLF
jgi:glycerol-3-phosphate acyltransferase PlsY